uniref:Gamma-glutamyltransferase n=1 Tax=Ditylum brightwellii TaxID=49249 RepID=A0A7S4RHQ9_9STRA
MSSSKSPNGSRNIRNSGLHVPDILSESNRSTSGGSIRSIGNNGHRHHRRTRRGRHRSSFTESQNRPTSFTEGAKRAFSLILGTDDSEEDEDSRSNNHYHDGRLMLTARWTGKWKRRLILLTVISVLLTLLSRSIYNGNNSDGGSTASATTNGVHSTNGNDDVTTTEFDNVKQSCREFFEPDPIMKLKNMSTVENLKYGAVASDNAICSNLGLSILRDHGGNAVDAAVATTLCLGVVNPASSGIGGGGFILIHSDADSHESIVEHKNYTSPPFDDKRNQTSLPSTLSSSAKKEEDESNERRKTTANAPENTTSQEGKKKKKKVSEFIDCRETAPSAATYDMYENLPPKSSVDGGLAIAVPAELRGLELAHSRHGSLPWKDVVRPAMELARDGFEVTHYVAYDIAINKEKIQKFPDLMRVLSKNREGKSLLELGDTLKRPELAKTLELVMERGADAIYTGNLAQQIVKDIQNAGGIITESDLANYRPVVRDPLISRDVFGFTMIGSPPPSSGGGAIIGAARFLSGYATPMSSFADTLSKHRLVEAMKHVFAIRMSLSDPAYNTSVTVDAINDMTRGSYMEKLRRQTPDGSVLPLSQYGGRKWAQLNDGEGQGKMVDAHEGDRRKMKASTTTVQQPEDGEGQYQRQMRLFGYLEDHGTTHLSVVDKDRNAVAITSSVNTYYGSGVTSPSTGIIFNSQVRKNTLHSLQ